MRIRPKLLILIISCLNFNPVFSAPIPSVKDFFVPANIQSIRISPDGEHFVAQVMINGSKNIAIMKRTTKEIVYTYEFAGDEKEVGSDFGWLNNERIYAHMVRKVGPLEIPQATGHLHAGNIDGSKTLQLLPKRGDYPRNFRILSYLEDDPKHILVELGQFNNGRKDVFLLNVNTGKQKKVVKARFGKNRFDIDNDAKVRIQASWDNDYKYLSVYYRENDTSSWELIDKRNTEESSYRVISFTPDNRQFYYFGSNENITGIFQFDPVSKKSDLIHEIKGDQNIVRYVYDEQSKQLIGVVREKEKLVYEYFEKFPQEVAKHQAITRSFLDQYVRVLSDSKDGTLSVLFVQSDKNIGSFYLYDRKAKEISYLMNIKPELPPARMGERKPFSFVARDGLEIRGLLTLPPEKQKELPMVVLVHGGPYGIQDSWLFDTESQFLANNGYAVLQVNYRGSGGRGLNFIYDNYRKMGKEMQDDLTDATHWAIEQGYADKSRVCIYGASYGGYAALMGAVIEPELYKCAIGYAGVYDITVQAEESDTKDSRNGRVFLEDAWNAFDTDFVKERSAAFHVEKIKAALFLVHGTNDKRTPLENYEVLTEALDKINYPYESMVKEGEGHGFFDVDNRVELYTRMLKFLNKHIGK